MELTAQEVWARITDAARDVLPEQTFRTWLSATEAVTLSDETLVVGAPTRFAVEWIEDKYGPLLADLAERQMGRALELRFEHRGQSQQIEIPEISAPEPELAGDGAGAAAAAAPESRGGEGLNERYTFGRFVIGGNNQLAAAACQRVADAPAKAYNPLFIYGDTGLGKTHLMHAIGHAILERDPGARVAYIPSEQFTNEMVSAIQSGRTPEFRQRYRQIDVLLVDDVHFLGNKEGTQEEFFHTFNSLYDAQKQIVVASDRPPQEIPGLQERLVSRFEWGLVTDIKAPDFETRVAILQKKAAEDRLVLDDAVIEYIARHRKTSVRQLEGAVIKLLAYSSLTRREINLDLAREALGGADEAEPEPERATPEEIRRRTAEAWGVTVDGLTSRRRTRNLTVPRQIAMYLIKTLLDLPYTEIGELFGGRDHSTVIHSVNKVEADMASDPEFRRRVRELREELVA
ncbi:MAG TPA: chromosomal replication initiator protein DnaA [Gemmatimonadota bacterium]|nr:chromosomal replication initiator protein DnaA [Gemmatimonadota bacterium]